MSKMLVVYYTFEGTTKRVAEAIAEKTASDIMAIKPVKEIKSNGFSKYFWGGSQVVMGKKPELVPFSKAIDDYDVIFVGSPIWAGTYAPPIKTLLEEDFIKGKKVGYFYCHEGGDGKAAEKAKKAIEKKNDFISALGLIAKNMNDDELSDKIEHWIKQMDI